MKIKEHWKYYLSILIMFIGLTLMLRCFDALMDYHESTSKYIEAVDPLLERLDGWSSIHGSNQDLNQLVADIDRARFFNSHAYETSQVPKKPSAQFTIGVVMIGLGIFFGEKHKPKPKEKTPDSEPTNPWSSLPAPELKKNPAINDQD